MKAAGGGRWLLVAAVVAISGSGARAADSYSGQSLIRPRFDRLIPTTSPVIRPGFHRLVQTTWPLINPGIARLPMTQDLIRPSDQPLLIVNQGGAGPLPVIRPKRETVIVTTRVALVSRMVMPRSGKKAY